MMHHLMRSKEWNSIKKTREDSEEGTSDGNLGSSNEMVEYESIDGVPLTLLENRATSDVFLAASSSQFQRELSQLRLLGASTMSIVSSNQRADQPDGGEETLPMPRPPKSFGTTSTDISITPTPPLSFSPLSTTHSSSTTTTACTAPVSPPTHTRMHSIEHVKSLFDAEFRSSSLQDQSGDLPRFSLQELFLGKVLGKGAFGMVTEIRCMKVVSAPQNSRTNSTKSSSTKSAYSRNHAPNNHYDEVEEEDEDRDEEEYHRLDEDEAKTRIFLSQNCVRSSGHPRFVVKQLRPDIIKTGSHTSNDKQKQQDKKLQGIADLPREAFFLRRIRHPNIIRLRGISYASEFEDSYFLILDRLYRTLPSVLDEWREQEKLAISHHDIDNHPKAPPKNGLGLRRRLCLLRRQQQHCWNESMKTICFALSSALSYLHRHGILYRDLKPANIGFDFHNNLRLFDFAYLTERRSTISGVIWQETKGLSNGR